MRSAKSLIVKIRHPFTPKLCIDLPSDFWPPVEVVEVVDLELVAAGENSKPQDSSRDSTSPAAFVNAAVGHENSD